MDIYKSDKIFTKKFQFNSFFTKAVKKLLVEKFGKEAHFNFEVTQDVLIQSHTSRKSENGLSGVRPFPFKLDVSKTSGFIYIDGRSDESMFVVKYGEWEELSEEVVKGIVDYTAKLLADIVVNEDSKPFINIEVSVHIDADNYTPMNDPESLKLVRELEGKPAKPQSNELQEIVEKIRVEGVDPEVVTKIVEIVMVTLPIVLKLPSVKHPNVKK
jgi:hypothetical protein